MSLNFNEEGNVYKTSCGAFLSFLVFGLLFYLVVIKKGTNMIKRSSPQIN